MAHVAKYTQAQSPHLMNHYNRDKEAPCQRSNENIDPERTGQNYNLMEREQTPQQYFTERMGEVYHMDREDLKCMCDWVITLPQGYEGDTREFFAHAVDFLNDRYGAENCIGAFVHLDETTPHMHYSFMPVVEDRKHEQGYKISAKEVIDRGELKSFHDDLQRHMRERLPDKDITLYRDEEQRAKERSDRSIEEFKDFKAQERIDKLKEATHRREIDLVARNRDMDRVQSYLDERQQTQERYNQYWDRVEDYKAQNDMTDREYFMACYRADQGLQDYPAPEKDNPDRDLQTHEVESPERDAPEREVSPDR